jgi:hypothetical protein
MLLVWSCARSLRQPPRPAHRISGRIDFARRVNLPGVPRFLIFRNFLDSTPKSGVSSVTSRLDTRGVSRSSRNAGRDAVDAAALGVRWDRGADCFP